MKECPCKQCLTIVICRDRKYHDLVKMCDPLWEFLGIVKSGTKRSRKEIKQHNERALVFEGVLKPTKWRVGSLIGDKDGYAVVSHITQ